MSRPTVNYIDQTGRLAKADEANLSTLDLANGVDDLSALTDAAEIIAKRARELGGSLCRSTRIPAATHTGHSGGNVAVITSGNAAPNAAPFEGGEDHPLWAHRGSWRYSHSKWGQQPYKPYMLMAADQVIGDAAEAFGNSVYLYAMRQGFK